MSRRLKLTVGRDSLRAEVLRRGVVVWAGEAAHAGPSDMAETIAQLAGEAAVRGVSRAEVIVGAPAAQLRRLDGLPPVSRRALPALVAHQQKRFFRRNGSPLITSAGWEPAGRWWRRPVRAELAAVDEAWAEAIARGLGAAGLRIGYLGPAGASARVGVVPPSVVASRRRRTTRAVRRWVAAAMLLWATAAGVYAIRLRGAQARLRAAIAAVEPAAIAVRDARAGYHRGRDMLAVIAGEEAAGGAILTQLAIIAAALPDSAVLTVVTIDSAGAGTIGGLARDANRVVAALERDGSVRNPRLDGVVAREAFAGREWDRFSIEFGGAPR